MRDALKRVAGACCLLACLAALAAAQAPGGRERRDAWRRLLAYEGRDLWRLEGRAAASVAALVNRLAPDMKEPGTFSFLVYRPRLLERIGTREGTRHVLLVSTPDFDSPGRSWHRLHFFDDAGRLRGSSVFSSGWPLNARGVRVTARGGGGAALLELRAASAGAFAGYAHAPPVVQHYALLGDRAVLLRLEDVGGAPLRNAYRCPYPEVGPPPPQKTAGEWARSLASADRVEVLQALMWVGGHHERLEALQHERERERDLREKFPGPNDNPLLATLDRCPGAAHDAATYADVRARADVRRRIEKLSRSGDRWVRQAASLALAPAEWEEWTAVKVVTR